MSDHVSLRNVNHRESKRVSLGYDEQPSRLEEQNKLSRAGVASAYDKTTFFINTAYFLGMLFFLYFKKAKKKKKKKKYSGNTVLMLSLSKMCRTHSTNQL